MDAMVHVKLKTSGQYLTHGHAWTYVVKGLLSHSILTNLNNLSTFLSP